MMLVMAQWMEENGANYSSHPNTPLRKAAKHLEAIPQIKEVNIFKEEAYIQFLKPKGPEGHITMRRYKGSFDMKEDEFPPYLATINDEILNKHVDHVGSIKDCWTVASGNLFISVIFKGLLWMWLA